MSVVEKISSPVFIPKNRIIPPFLRERKTEALLVFIRTILDNHLADSKKKSTNNAKITNSTELIKIISELRIDLGKYVVNYDYLEFLIENSSKGREIAKITKIEESLMFYYNCIVKSYQNVLKSNEKWVCEILVIGLLSEWFLDNEKGMEVFPFMRKYDFLAASGLIEELNYEDDSNKKLYMKMYKVGNKIIEDLANAKYKININRKSKTRKKRR